MNDSEPERGARTAMSGQQIKDIWTQEPPRQDGPVTVVDYDPAWPVTFAAEAEQPIIDMLMVVADPADEPTYAEDLIAAGYRLVIREPNWYDHRAFKGPDADRMHLRLPGEAGDRRCQDTRP